jgi:hypothetical protein
LRWLGLRRSRDLANTTTLHSPLGASHAAALRTALRHLVKRQKALSGIVARNRFRVNRRLDAQANCRPAPSSGRAYRVLPIKTGQQPAMLPLLVSTGLPTTTRNSPQKLFIRSRYRRWHAARATHKLLLQKQLRVGVLSPVAISRTQASTPQTVTKYLLQRRGDSIARRVISARINALRVAPKLPLQNTLPRTPLARLHVARAPLSRTTTNKKAFKPRIHTFGFLNRALGTLRGSKYTATDLDAEAALSRQERHYREIQFYHNRPKMRLPQTRVTRGRRRKAGLVTFVRNSLQPARNLIGQSRYLLPPVNAYSRVTAAHAVGFAPTATSLAVYKPRADLLPIF